MSCREEVDVTVEVERGMVVFSVEYDDYLSEVFFTPDQVADVVRALKSAAKEARSPKSWRS